MNLDTGALKQFLPDEFESLPKDEKERWLEIETTMMTQKQKSEMQVNIHDTKSTLGKVFSNARHRRKAIRKIK
jgi:hypothetical protein